ncbi:GOLD domain [Cinara cedri]|uniref:GOLD domain n=1 Tax=Cinara cedri TaxID=506608 RepID=A0A5E4NQQ3_9HEMI|nr:GOLD domain [Cinara cedri]
MINRHQEKNVFIRFYLLFVCILAYSTIHCAITKAQSIPLPQEQQFGPTPQDVPTLPWYEYLPTLAVDFKVIIEPGKDECYFQFVNPGATFYVNAQVVKEGEMVGFTVKHPNGQIVHSYEQKASLNFQDPYSTGGSYSVCVDNTFSKFDAKKVNVYISVIRYDKFEIKEIRETNLNFKNVTTILNIIQNNINFALKQQEFLISQEDEDYFYMLKKEVNVNCNGFLIMLVIFLSSIVQVCFICIPFNAKYGNLKIEA